MKFDRGFISPYFITSPKTQKVEVENPFILLVEKKVSSLQSMLPLLEQVVKTQKPLIIIAEDVDGEALATLVVNKLRGGMNVAAVKAPGFGDNRKATLQDMAVLTGATVISEDVGMKLETAEFDVLGTCKKITISKDDTIMLDGAGEKASIEERCAPTAHTVPALPTASVHSSHQGSHRARTPHCVGALFSPRRVHRVCYRCELLRETIADTTSEYEKEKLQERRAMSPC